MGVDEVRRSRPARVHETGKVTQRIRLASVALVGLAAAALLVRYPSLPETIPTHFNALGEADGWGPRSSVLILALVGVAMTLGLAWLSRFPNYFNYMVEVTEENAAQVYRAGEQMMVGVTLSVALIFTGIMGASGTSINVVIFVVPGLLIMVGAIGRGLARPFG